MSYRCLAPVSHGQVVFPNIQVDDNLPPPGYVFAFTILLLSILLKVAGVVIFKELSFLLGEVHFAEKAFRSTNLYMFHHELKVFIQNPVLVASYPCHCCYRGCRGPATLATKGQ